MVSQWYQYAINQCICPLLPTFNLISNIWGMIEQILYVPESTLLVLISFDPSNYLIIQVKVYLNFPGDIVSERIIFPSVCDYQYTYSRVMWMSVLSHLTPFLISSKHLQDTWLETWSDSGYAEYQFVFDFIYDIKGINITTVYSIHH